MQINKYKYNIIYIYTHVHMCKYTQYMYLMNGNPGMQDAPRSISPLPAATEVEEEEALMALADLSGSELLVCTD
jgi:hypothetical protein